MKIAQSPPFIRNCAGREAEIAEMMRIAFAPRFGSGDEEVGHRSGSAAPSDVIAELRRPGTASRSRM